MPGRPKGSMTEKEKQETVRKRTQTQAAKKALIAALQASGSKVLGNPKIWGKLGTEEIQAVEDGIRKMKRAEAQKTVEDLRRKLKEAEARLAE